MNLRVCLSALFLAATGLAARADVETIVCLRHGEKTPTEMGQLNIKGLNRSLALPDVLLAKYGKPQFIFAPDPARDLVGGKNGEPKQYYLRPLATIEPTAIRLGMPVNTAFGFTDIAGLETELMKPAYQNALIFVSWEHGFAGRFAAKVVGDLGGAAAEVPKWPSPDYDSLYVVRIERTDGKVKVAFIHDREGLDGMSETPPKAAPAGN